MKVYLAGFISGYSYDDVENDFNSRKWHLERLGYEVLSPMTGKGQLRNEIELKAYDYSNPVSCNHAIFERDKWMVSNCDIVFANLLNPKHVSIGITMELAWASLLGKHTVVVMEESNVHKHAFIIESADIIFNNMGDALQYFTDLTS